MPSYRIIVDLKSRMLHLLDHDIVIHSYPVAIGRIALQTPMVNFW